MPSVVPTVRHRVANTLEFKMKGTIAAKVLARGDEVIE
jgi:hypothetical protein